MQPIHHSAHSRVRRLAILVMSAVVLSGCPAPVKPPAPRSPVPQAPVPAPVPKIQPPKTIHQYPAQIALLLPLSGRQQAAGMAVRDGFFAGYFQQDSARRPRIRVYDIGNGDIGGGLLRAVDEGAQFIVGPLTKDDVGAAAEIADGRVGALALNFLADGRKAPANFYQFALSPEDEARLVARRIRADGRLRGVALVPNGDWGTRVLNAFADELNGLGGELLARSNYAPQENDHSPVIQQLLRLSDSRQRYERLTALLGTKLEFQPRRRGDIDFIFVGAQPSQGRLIRPQLRFHYAGDIPMYSTSDIFDPGEKENIDLDGVQFPDMPWMIADRLSGDAASAAIRDSLQQLWPSRLNHRGRLYAFGVDAYHLLPLLSARAYRGTNSNNEYFNGATGRLTIDTEGRIRRDLDWVMIRDGQPRALPNTGAAPKP